jgi:hypothetical protein
MKSVMFQYQGNSDVGYRGGGLVRCFSKYRHKKLCPASPSAQLDISIESPLVCYGPPANSTGALLTGHLHITQTESDCPVVLHKLSLSLVFEKATNYPVSRRCHACATSAQELNRWDFVTQFHLKNQTHDHRFEYRIPGHLPASCCGSLGQVIYFLHAYAKSITGDVSILKVPIKVSRALGFGVDKISVRTFPPTTLTLKLIRPSVVSLGGRFPLKVILAGIMNKCGKTLIRWRLMKFAWRIKEHQEVVSRACEKHISKAPSEGKCAVRRKTRVIGQNELIGGWNFDSAGGEIRMELEASASPAGNSSCEADCQDGLRVTHDLVIELVIIEDVRVRRNKKLHTQHCATRVLRRSFRLYIAEHRGLDACSDVEMPPVYEDVPARPPVYGDSDALNHHP